MYLARLKSHLFTLRIYSLIQRDIRCVMRISPLYISTDVGLLRNLLFLIRFQSNCNPLDELHVLTFVGKITQRINRILVCLQIHWTYHYPLSKSVIYHLKINYLFTCIILIDSILAWCDKNTCTYPIYQLVRGRCSPVYLCYCLK